MKKSLCKITSICIVSCAIALSTTSCSKEKAKAKVKTLLGSLDSTNTIEGVDANKDGIRDDIEKIIEELPDLSRAAKNGLRFYQKSAEERLLKSIDPDTSLEYVQKKFKAYFCIEPIWFGPDDGTGQIKKHETANMLLAATINTELRTNKYFQIEKLLDGQQINGDRGSCPEFSKSNKQGF